MWDYLTLSARVLLTPARWRCQKCNIKENGINSFSSSYLFDQDATVTRRVFPSSWGLLSHIQHTIIPTVSPVQDNSCDHSPLESVTENNPPSLFNNLSTPRQNVKPNNIPGYGCCYVKCAKLHCLKMSL